MNLVRRNPEHKSPRASFLTVALAASLVLGVSCTDPQTLKPVPALHPEDAPVKREPALEKPAAPSVPGSVTRMPLGDLYQLVQSEAALIYDVRPKIFYAMGHVPGAISWPKSDFQSGLATHEPRIRSANSANTPVVIYCTDLACPDASSVATALAAKGHTISILQGGYDAWKATNR